MRKTSIYFNVHSSDALTVTDESFLGFQNMGITFLGADMDHWCNVPQLHNVSGTQQRYIGIPDDEHGRQEYSQCYMYDIDYRYGALLQL